MVQLVAALVFLAPRFAVVTASNEASGQQSLRYAERDAAAVADVLRQLGGFDEGAVIVLPKATPASIRRALGQIEQAARHQPGSLVVFYYSGHADAEGLLLGDERFSYGELRDRLEHSPATVRLALLDACQSGAATRSKGGHHDSGFALDVVDPARVGGAAIITASTASEQAQESSDIDASYFTHYLLSALRGAADQNGDGRVTLAEAYDYAYARTVAATAPTLQGPQHPSYYYRLEGTGEVTLTELGRAGAALELPAGDGLFLVLDHRHELVAEARADGRRTTRLALAAGRYRVLERTSGRLLATEVELPLGATLRLVSTLFRPAPASWALGKGGAELRNVGYVEYGLYGFTLAKLGAASQVALSYHRRFRAGALVSRFSYSQADVDDTGFRYRLYHLALDEQVLARIALHPLELELGGGPGVVFMQQSSAGRPDLGGWAAALRGVASVGTVVWRRLALRLGVEVGGLLMRVNAELAVRLEVTGTLGVGVAF